MQAALMPAAPRPLVQRRQALGRRRERKPAAVPAALPSAAPPLRPEARGSLQRWLDLCG